MRTERWKPDDCCQRCIMEKRLWGPVDHSVLRMGKPFAVKRNIVLIDLFNGDFDQNTGNMTDGVPAAMLDLHSPSRGSQLLRWFAMMVGNQSKR